VQTPETRYVRASDDVSVAYQVFGSGPPTVVFCWGWMSHLDLQWTNADRLAAAHHSPEFRKKWPRFGELVKEADPCLYDVVHVEAA